MAPKLAVSPQKIAWLGIAGLGSCVVFGVPDSGAAGVVCLGLAAGAGIGIARWRRRAVDSPPAWLLDAAVVVAIVAVAVAQFWSAWHEVALRAYDWAPHHANLVHLVDAMREGRSIPRWVGGVSTGDSPYELYPSLPYELAARIAVLVGATDLSLLLARAAIVVHTLAAVSVALLTRRVAATPWAVVVGTIALLDTGSVWSGGAEGLFRMGVAHSALSNAVWPLVLAATIRLLRRPGLWAAIGVWLGVALAVACHPLGLVSAIATVVALALVALVATDVPPHRAWSALAHVVIGVCLAAVRWVPLGRRLVLYSVHFAVAGRLGWEGFAELIGARLFETATEGWLVAGLIGMTMGLVSRRAVPTLLAAFSGVLIAGLFDQLYVLLDLAPSLETARFQTVRLASASKPTLYVLGAYAFSRAFFRFERSRLDRGAIILAGLLGIVAIGVARGAVPYFDRVSREIRDMSHWETPDEEGLLALARWASEQKDALPDGREARLLHEDSRRFYSIYHVHALSGLPTVWVGPTSCLFLRERIEDASPESLRRFDVRWVVRRGASPSLGDPATERRFGQHYLRELASWDGRFARVEKGEGSVWATRIDDERIDVEVSGATSLVALGMGYYPRWEAHHEERGRLPVYAFPSKPGARLRVPAAWLPPGKTTFRPSGALPSDGRGWGLFLLAVLAGAFTVLTTVRARWRIGGLRLWGRVRRRGRRHARTLGWVAVVVGSVALAGSAVLARLRPQRALQLGNGLVGTAEVELQRADGWRTCPYSPLHGGHRCSGPVFVQDSMAELLDDAPPSPPFAVPAIVVTNVGGAKRIRIRLPVRLEGEYWAASSSSSVRMTLGEQPLRMVPSQQSTWTFEEGQGRGELTLELTVPRGGKAEVALVRRDAIDPERDYPTPPDHPPF